MDRPKQSPVFSIKCSCCLRSKYMRELLHNDCADITDSQSYAETWLSFPRWHGSRKNGGEIKEPSLRTADVSPRSLSLRDVFPRRGRKSATSSPEVPFVMRWKDRGLWERDWKVCDSATEIPYWWRKICPESGQKRWLVDRVPAREPSLSVAWARRNVCRSQAKKNQFRNSFECLSMITFCAQSEAGIRVSRRTGSVRVASQAGSLSRSW